MPLHKIRYGIGNTANEDGGGIYNFNLISILTLSNSTVSGNTANSGGGIYNLISILTLSNSTVSGNTANSGGGIVISDRLLGATFPVQVILLYCTVYGNTAGVGGGIWIDNLDKKSQVTIGASIVAGIKAHTSPDIAGRLTTLGYNLVGDRSGATFLGSPKLQSTDVLGVSSTTLKIDPLLRDNGGSAQPHTRTHALLPGSPAIDKIPLDACHRTIPSISNFLGTPAAQYTISTDQRGLKRPDENELACDIGAYESSP